METVLESLNLALHEAMKADERVYVIGEDILDPYGGAFKVTAGLSSNYPQRVLSTPVSEAGIIGLAIGMALRGLLPVIEIMFGDFLLLAADQIMNSLVKFPWMYGKEVATPLVIRTPMGGRRGYGPTHSQTLEKHFLGIPGLRILAPTSFGNPGELLRDAILNDELPVLFIENKLQYQTRLKDRAVLNELGILLGADGILWNEPPLLLDMFHQFRHGLKNTGQSRRLEGFQNGPVILIVSHCYYRSTTVVIFVRLCQKIAQ